MGPVAGGKLPPPEPCISVVAPDPLPVPLEGGGLDAWVVAGAVTTGAVGVVTAGEVDTAVVPLVAGGLVEAFLWCAGLTAWCL